MTETARQEFERKHPQPQKLFVVDKSVTFSMETFWPAYGAGRRPSLICYTPPNMDAVRWKLGKYWTPKGTVVDDSQTEYGPDNRLSGKYSMNPLWVLGAETPTNPLRDKPGVVNNFNSFPYNPKGRTQGEYKWSDINSVLRPCPGCAPNERKETLVVGQGGNFNAGLSSWGLNDDGQWQFSVDSNEVTADHSAFVYPSPNGNPHASAFPGARGVRGKVFQDHACELEMPFSKEQIGERGFGQVRQLYVDIKPTYNFFIEAYETRIDEEDVDERMLPNMYAFMLVQQEQDPEDVIVLGESDTVNDIFERHLTLDKTIDKTMFTINQAGLPLTKLVLSQRGQENFMKSSKGQYFDKFANNYDNFIGKLGNDPASPNATDILMSRFSNLVVPMSDLKLYRDFNSKHRQFPMSVDISFSTDITKTFFADALKESRLSSTFVKDIISEGSDFISGADISLIEPDVEIPNAYDYGEDPDGPVVLVWWGNKSVGPVRSWQSNGGMWTRVTNIVPVDPNLHGQTYRIGDWVTVKEGASRGGQNASWGQTNVEAQIIGYIDKVNAVSSGRTAPRGSEPHYRIVDRNELKSGAKYYPRQVSRLIVDRRSPGGRRLSGHSLERSIERNDTGRPEGEAWQLYGRAGTDSFVEVPTRSWNPMHYPAGVERPPNYSLTNLTRKQTISTRLNEWDITKWFDDFTATTTPQSLRDVGNDQMVFLGQYNEDVQEAEAGTDFLRTLMKIIFAGKYTNLINEKTRSYQQILAGKQAHTETVFYKVEKWSVNDDGEYVGDAPIQSIYFPNSSDTDVHHYIDTQVKYGKRYGYRVYSFEAIFGTKYRYSLEAITGLQPPPGGGANSNVAVTSQSPRRKAEICVFTSPSVKLVQVPYYEFVGRVMDAPPIWPDVDIIQYRSKNNKVLFFFRGSVGDYKVNPIPIELDDYVDIEDLREAQRVAESNGPLEYRSDDQARIFEIFRMDKKPTSYAEFQDHKLVEVKSDVFPDPKKSATAAAFADTIVPNKKYYYTFRAVDVHGHTSNPTPIYEIEIVDHDAGPALITNVFPIKKEKDPPQIPFRKAKKYIYITPTEDQLTIDPTKNNLLKDDGSNKDSVPAIIKQQGVEFGISDETVWGKKYKIRVISKKTGRKIDFNVECTTGAEPDVTP